MKAILLLAGPYASCHATQLIWKNICDAHAVNLQSYDLTNAQGKTLSIKHNIKSFPALIVNNEIIAVGHPSEESAEKIMRALIL